MCEPSRWIERHLSVHVFACNITVPRGCSLIWCRQAQQLLFSRVACSAAVCPCALAAAGRITTVPPDWKSTAVKQHCRRHATTLGARSARAPGAATTRLTTGMRLTAIRLYLLRCWVCSRCGPIPYGSTSAPSCRAVHLEGLCTLEDICQSVSTKHLVPTAACWLGAHAPNHAFQAPWRLCSAAPLGILYSAAAVQPFCQCIRRLMGLPHC